MSNKITFTTEGNTTKANFDYDNLPDVEVRSVKRTPEGNVLSVNGKTGTVVLTGDDIPYDTNQTINQKINSIVSGEVRMTLIAPAFDLSEQYSPHSLVSDNGNLYESIQQTQGNPTTDTTYWTETTIAEVISHLARDNGYYANMSVGDADRAILAENFNSQMTLDDTTPYLFRTTGGGKEVSGQSRLKKIIGASVPIIQLVRYGNFSSGAGWDASGSGVAKSVANNQLTITHTSSDAGSSIKRVDINFISGHRYMLVMSVKSADKTIVNAMAYDGVKSYNFEQSGITNAFKTYSYIFTPSNSTSAGQLQLYRTYSSGENGTAVYQNVFIIDLTQTFGTTVANRLYTLEQAQTGTGIAKAKEILVKDYYPYNVTAFTHVKTTGKTNVGFNAYNNTTGTARLLGGNVWQITGAYTALAYTDDYGNAETITPDASGLFTPTNNGTLTVTGGNGTTTCIHLHWDGERDGEYEPYQEWNYPVDDIELKGILSLDAQDNWITDGDEYANDGTVTRRFDVVDLGTLDWTYNSAYSIFTATNSVAGKPTRCICNNYLFTGLSVGDSRSDKTINIGLIYFSSDGTAISVKDTTYTDAITFTTAMSGVYLVYPLATPTTSSATPYTELQNDSNWGTEKWIDTRDVPLPVPSLCQYLPDLKAKLEAAPESPDEDGDYIMHRENGINSYSSLSTWLSANGYNKLQDLSSYVTLVTGNNNVLVHKKAYKTGNVVTLTCSFYHSGSTGSEDTTVLTLGSAIRPVANLTVPVWITDGSYSLRVKADGDVILSKALAHEETVFVAISFTTA